MVAARLVRVPPFERGLTLGDFLVPIRVGERATSWQRHLLMVVAGTALIILCAKVRIPLPFTPVPITLQTFGVLFGGALLGFRRGLLSTTLYLLIGIVGFPVFAGDSSGAAQIASFDQGRLVLGATGGYLIGFVIASGLVGRLAELGWDRRIGGSVAAMALANALIYVVAIPWLMLAASFDFTTALEKGLWPFVIGDTLKVVAAAGLLPVGWWVVNRRSSER